RNVRAAVSAGRRAGAPHRRGRDSWGGKGQQVPVGVGAGDADGLLSAGADGDARAGDGGGADGGCADGVATGDAAGGAGTGSESAAAESDDAGRAIREVVRDAAAVCAAGN